MDKEVIRKIRKTYREVEKANSELSEIWKQNILFTWEWWFELSLVVLPWLFWFKFHKKESRSRLLYAGIFVMLISSWMDFFGVVNGLWIYPVKVIPTIPSFIVWDITLLPVIIMFLLQYTNKINPLFISVIFAALASFLGEPFFQWIGFYKPLNWKHIYSFPIFMIIYLISFYISTKGNFEKF